MASIMKGFIYNEPQLCKSFSKYCAKALHNSKLLLSAILFGEAVFKAENSDKYSAKTLEAKLTADF